MTQATEFSVPTTGPATPDVMYGRIDDNFTAALTGHSGASRPPYAESGTVWEDTSVTGQTRFYLYDGTDDILLFTVDTTNNRVVLAPQPYVDITGATTTDIGAITSGNVRVTGSGATITGLGVAPQGTTREILFSGAHTLTHNATSLILQNGGSNILTAAGDTMRLVSLGSGNWRQTDWQKATPEAGINLGTTVAASGTSIDFTGIPTGVARVTVMLVGISTSGSDAYRLQIGDSGGIETSGYSSASSALTSGVSSQNDTASFGLLLGSASAAIHGAITLSKQTGDTWVATGVVGRSDAAGTVTVAGSKTLSGTLDRVRLTTSGGTNTFDAGTMNISWEF